MTITTTFVTVLRRFKYLAEKVMYSNHYTTRNQVDSFFENINYNDGKGAFTLTFFEMTITDYPGFHVSHCTTFYPIFQNF
jgi:hypothetical protein